MVNVSGVFQCIVLLLSCVSSCFSAPRHPRVAEVLVKHDALICESVSLVRGRDVYGLLDVFIPPFPPKAAYVPSKARENTIVDASLSMVDAVSAAIRLDWKSSERSVDPVLQNVIRVVCDAGVDVVAFRKGARSFLRSLKANLVPLRVDLQELVPEFLKPIVGHVDFALMEVLIRAAKWVQESYVDSVILGTNRLGTFLLLGAIGQLLTSRARLFHGRTMPNRLMTPYVFWKRGAGARRTVLKRWRISQRFGVLL